MAPQEGPGLEIMTELSLGLPGSCPSTAKTDKKRVFSEIADDDQENNSTTTATTCDRKIQKKSSQVVGWPPVSSYRKKNNNVHQDKNGSDDSSSAAPKLYVKVAMDGAPYLRKIDLNVHKGYSGLVVATEKLFGCFGNIGGKEYSDGSEEYIPIYEDRDGDWMLVGDVPWTMFIESCKRLRVMKRSEAKGFGLQSWSNSSSEDSNGGD